MSWSVYLFKTISGQLGPRIEVEDLNWNITINETETLDMTLIKGSIPKFASTTPYLEPWWGGVALLWEDTAVFAGPIVTRPSEDFRSLRISARGIRAVLSKRMVVRDMVNWNNINNKTIRMNWSTDGREDRSNPLPVDTKFKDKSYATLAKYAVQESMTKLGGQLPIRFPVPDSTHIDPTTFGGQHVPVEKRPHYRRYAGYEGLSNNVDVVLTSLSEMDQGPDIMFRPMLSGESIYWDMLTGKSDSSPEIGNIGDTVWDTTAVGGHITNLSVQYSGSNMTNRAFGIGAGSDGGQPMAISQDTSKLSTGFPLLESSESFPQSSNPQFIQSKTTAKLKADDKARHQLSGTVRIDGASTLGTFWPGEYGRLITSGWYGLHNGETRAKILAISGSLSYDMNVSFKETEVL